MVRMSEYKKLYARKSILRIGLNFSAILRSALFPHRFLYRMDNPFSYMVFNDSRNFTANYIIL